MTDDVTKKIKPVLALTNSYSIRYDYDISGNMIYVGYTDVGNCALIANPVWSIIKYSYDGSNNLISKEYAGGDLLFDNVWDNRVSLSYS